MSVLNNFIHQPPSFRFYYKQRSVNPDKTNFLAQGSVFCYKTYGRSTFICQENVFWRYTAPMLMIDI